MTESNNFADINDNFNTIKTMLNTIRAQGVLNTSDIDKLLEGINSKLEKINTEEDIDLIKEFLSELKKNLDERHEVLISKFGAVESLFSNLLKNSSDTVKSPELKELFDIVATNLSVFSREVVSQKETLTDITLRLDAMRSDDSQKKDIIKSISTVRNDIEKVNNGFDSIVISLNENFKTVLKTISEVDQSEAITGFTEKIEDILNSSNTILSAIQLIDKKNNILEDSFDGLATRDDVSNIQKNLQELSANSLDLTNLVEVLTEKSYKVDNLAEKIDAAVNVIAGLKAEFANKDESVKIAIMERLSDLEAMVNKISDNSEFEEFKKSLQSVFEENSKGSGILKQSLESALKNIGKLNDDLQALDISSNFGALSNELGKVSEDIKEKFVSENDKLSQLIEANITRTLNDMSSGSDALNTRLKESHTLLSNLCEKSFEEVSESLSGLKEVIAQLDENNVSANNAIFSNITDRLAVFENSLKNSLEKQEDFVSGSSSQVFEQISNIKSLAEGIEYKLDSNAIEFGNAKIEYAELTKAVNSILALDFTNAVKDFKAELFAVKEDLSIAVENAQSDLSEGLTADLFGKYELLVSKLDSVEDQIKLTQAEEMSALKNVLSGISSSIVDILSYVSKTKEESNADLKEKLEETTRYIQDSNLNYIDNVRDIVDTIRGYIEDHLNRMSGESENRLNKITSSINESNVSLKNEIKNNYDKIVELQAGLNSLQDVLKTNNEGVYSEVNNIFASTNSLKEAFEFKMTSLKQSLTDMVSEFKSDFTCENADNVSELKFNAETLHTRYVEHSNDLKNELKAELAGIIESLKLNILGLSELVSGTTLKIEGANKEVVDFVKKDFTAEVTNSVDSIKNNTAEVLSEIDNKVTDVVDGFGRIESAVNNLSKETTTSLSGTLAKVLENFVSLNSLIESFDTRSSERLKESVEELNKDFDVLKRKISDLDSQFDEDLSQQISIIEGNFESLNLMMVDIMNQATDTLGERIRKELNGASAHMSQSLAEELEQYKIQIAELFEGMLNKNSEQAEFIKGCATELNTVLNDTLVQQGKDSVLQLEAIGNHLKEMIHENVEVTSADYDDLKCKLNDFTDRVERQNNVLVDTIRAQLDDVAKFVDSNIDVQAQEVNSAFEEISSNVQKAVSTVREFNEEWSPKLSQVQTALNDMNEKIDVRAVQFDEKFQTTVEQDIRPGFEKLKEKLSEFLEHGMPTFVTQYTNTNSVLQENIASEMLSLKNDLQAIADTIEKGELSRIDIQQTQINELKDKFNAAVVDLKDFVRSDIAGMLIENDNQNYNKLTFTVEEKIEYIKEQLELTKQNTVTVKDIITALVKEHSELISREIEKESDFVVNTLIEQVNNLRDSHKDDLSLLSTAIENTVSDYIANAVSDLKLYMDEKTDTSGIDGKIDSLRVELSKSLDDTIENINKLLHADVFADALADLRATNEILLGSMAEKMTTQILDFVKVNVSTKFDEKINLLDKKFIETVVDKYEEIKILSTQYKSSFEKIADSVSGLVSKFTDSKEEINNTLKTLISGINDSVDELRVSFAELKAQIMNKSFDEAFHESVHNMVKGIENLVHEQMGYIEDISDLCCNNLPEVMELNTLVKHNITKSIDELINKLEKQDDFISHEFDALKADTNTQQKGVINELNLLKSDIGEKQEQVTYKLNSLSTDINEQQENVKNELNSLKTDIITQFIDIFNQISFVAEQEEILDFIQEKHSELITILSHIVTTSGDVEEVKENLALVDSKIDVLKEDIDLINEKLTSIMSAEGDIDYVYSLQDIESDIANLRLVLNEMKNDNKSKEFEELIESTNNIYQIVSAIKSELPKFEAEEFKKDFSNLAEDIVSISTRTNKLLLTSDESYKTLQDNLQDFKLVIDDLDERTRNFAHEAGIDKIDNKLASINSMIKSGAQTNQVFNQIFEYLAEWVDNAGEQLAVISDKVDTLDDIGQIRVMLEDLRAESQENADSEELVNALEQVFDKQTKRISSLEAKLDKMIVASNVNNKKSKSDVKPIEDALKSFLSVIEGKFVSQQEKISSLETKLEEVVSLMDNKDTAQLTKKVGGMDKQLAKLNKSIEKIASNVVEK